MTTTTDYPDYSFTYRGIKARLTYIGEGYHGDYDPSDPDDAPLYRLDIERGRANAYGDTACTYIVAGLEDYDYPGMIRKIARYAHARHFDGETLEKIVAHLSWMNNDDLDQYCGATV